MKKIVILLGTITILFFSATLSKAGIWGESVSLDDLRDQRTFTTDVYNPPWSTGGLTGYWPGFTISWDIAYDFTTLLWAYEYTLSAIKKDISHFILELTEGTTQNDFINLTINGIPADFGEEIEGPKYWGQHPGNPGFPSSTYIYGIKFDTGGSSVTYSFETANDPVWGNFYSKSGKDKGNWVYAYNTGLEDYNSNNKLDFIVRPDGGNNPPVVPEPVSSILFITGGVILTIKHYRKKQ